MPSPSHTFRKEWGVPTAPNCPPSAPPVPPHTCRKEQGSQSPKLSQSQGSHGPKLSPPHPPTSPVSSGWNRLGEVGQQGGTPSPAPPPPVPFTAGGSSSIFSSLGPWGRGSSCSAPSSWNSQPECASGSCTGLLRTSFFSPGSSRNCRDAMGGWRSMRPPGAGTPPQPSPQPPH